jgi:predicted RNase H-like HicB family nuclease
MKKTVRVKVSTSETHFVAECVDLPDVTQGRNLEELTNNIQEAVALHLEDQDLEILPG